MLDPELIQDMKRVAQAFSGVLDPEDPADETGWAKATQSFLNLVAAGYAQATTPAPPIVPKG